MNKNAFLQSLKLSNNLLLFNHNKLDKKLATWWWLSPGTPVSSHSSETHISLIGDSKWSVWVNGVCVLRWTGVTPIGRQQMTNEWLKGWFNLINVSVSCGSDRLWYAWSSPWVTAAKIHAINYTFVLQQWWIIHYMKNSCSHCHLSLELQACVMGCRLSGCCSDPIIYLYKHSYIHAYTHIYHLRWEETLIKHFCKCACLAVGL